MAVWTIEVVNETGAAQDFFVFSQPPEVRFAGQAVAVHPSAWITYPGVQPGERRRSTFSESISIYVDLNGAKPAPGVVLVESANVPVDARARDSVSLLTDFNSGIFGPVEHGRSEYGTVSLHTSDPLVREGFPPPSTVGLGKFGDSDLPYPIAGFAPKPGGVFVIKPSRRFHLAQGRPLRGEALALHPPSLVDIDFDVDDLKATITARADGVFAVAYGAN